MRRLKFTVVFDIENTVVTSCEVIRWSHDVYIIDATLAKAVTHKIERAHLMCALMLSIDVHLFSHKCPLAHLIKWYFI
jgi:hypothetical protein